LFRINRYNNNCIINILDYGKISAHWDRMESKPLWYAMFTRVCKNKLPAQKAEVKEDHLVLPLSSKGKIF
jgi:hypothetical protein